MLCRGGFRGVTVVNQESPDTQVRKGPVHSMLTDMAVTVHEYPVALTELERWHTVELLESVLATHACTPAQHRLIADLLAQFTSPARSFAFTQAAVS